MLVAGIVVCYLFLFVCVVCLFIYLRTLYFYFWGFYALIKIVFYLQKSWALYVGGKKSLKLKVTEDSDGFSLDPQEGAVVRISSGSTFHKTRLRKMKILLLDRLLELLHSHMAGPRVGLV